MLLHCTVGILKSLSVCRLSGVVRILMRSFKRYVRLLNLTVNAKYDLRCISIIHAIDHQIVIVSLFVVS